MPSESSGVRGSGGSFWKGRGGRLLLIFLVALGLRIVYLLQVHENASFQMISLDSDLYDQKALEILRSDFWGSEIFYSAPLYPYFLALLYAIGGPSFFLVRVVQIILGSATAVLVVLLAEKLFDEPVPWVAGLLAALYTPLIFFSAMILGTTLAVFLVTLAILLFLVSLSEGGRRRLLIAFLAGVSIGCSSLLRPNTVVLLPLWVASLWILLRGLRWIRPAALLLFGGALVIGPVTIRNAVIGRDFVPISSHGGINFWIGNHPNALGTFDLPPGIHGTPEEVNLIDSTRLATQAAGRALKPSEVSTYWFRKGWDYIWSHPGEYARLLIRKIRMFWNRTEVPLNVNFHFLQRSSPLLRIPLMDFGSIAPLALVGLILTLRRWRTLLPAYALVITYSVTAVAFFVSGRYRLAAVPVLILFASFALWWLVSAAWSRKWKTLLPVAAALCVLAVHSNIPVEGFDVERSFARDYYYLGDHFQSVGRLPEALEHYEKSIQLNPGLWMAQTGRGTCLFELGRPEEAIASLRRAAELAPARPEPWSNLGLGLARLGRLPEAISSWERALDLDPSNETARSNIWRARRMLEDETAQPQTP